MIRRSELTIAITGPRVSGKTTLLKEIASHLAEIGFIIDFPPQGAEDGPATAAGPRTETFSVSFPLSGDHQ